MDLRHLRYFMAVANTLSFSRAARVLYLSQPSLSQQIANLEKELGVQLFQRDKHTVALTPAGEVLFDRAEKLLAQADSLNRELQMFHDTCRPAQSLWVGIDERILFLTQRYHVFSNAVQKLEQSKPYVKVQFYIQSLENVSSLFEQRTDGMLFALTGTPEQENWQYGCSILKERLGIIYRSPGLKCETLKSLFQRYPLMVLNQDAKEMPRVLQLFHQRDVQPQVAFCQNEAELLVNAMSGTAAVVMRESVIRSLDNENLCVFPLEGESSIIHLMAAWNEGGTVPLATCFAEYVRQELLAESNKATGGIESLPQDGENV